MQRRLRTNRTSAAAPQRLNGLASGLDCQMISINGQESSPLLSETARLLEGLEQLSAVEDLDRLEWLSSARAASYRVLPDRNHPFVRFYIAEANYVLLAFAGKPAPGFEVLEVCRAGFQFHWRRDLLRTFDEQLPLVGRLCGLSSRHELVVEHLSLPIIRKGRVREIRGWFVFGEELSFEAARLDGISMFRRRERSRPLQLPATLTRPGTETAEIQGNLGVLSGRWRAGRKRGRPCLPTTSARPGGRSGEGPPNQGGRPNIRPRERNR